jgi:predicted branched-subunit amino acid permease
MAAVKKNAHIVFFLAGLILFAVSLHLFRQSFGINSPWFASLAMFCVLGVAALGRGDSTAPQRLSHTPLALCP